MDHETLAKSFLTVGEEYERFRPGFPAAAARLIVPERVANVLDLAAGTGKFTEQLVSRADRVVAVEPSAPMLDVLRRKLPGVEAVIGSAESIPLDESSIDVVSAAQAFHWFDRDAACAEIGRVLVPGGTLGLLWNHSDPTCTWDRACYRVAHPTIVDESTMTAAAEEVLPGFSLVEKAAVPWWEDITRADYVSRWLTVSTFLAADDETRSGMVGQIERILDEDPDTAGRTELRLPQVTEVFVYRSDAR